jgi:acetyltransferase-like isoleucine patch superfamily enzyme
MSNKLKAIQLKFKGWSLLDVFSTAVRISKYFTRGSFDRIFMASTKGLVLVGKGVDIRHPNNLYAGKDLVIEDYVELNCLATNKMILGDRITIGRFAVIRPSNSWGGEIGEGLKVGNNSSIGTFNYIGCSGYIEIGNNVMLGPRVGLFAENHVYDSVYKPIKDQGVVRKTIVIEDDCWIGTNSVVLSGVRIGTGSVVAAGSVVTKDVAPFSVVAGVPAKLIKSRLAGASTEMEPKATIAISG